MAVIYFFFLNQKVFLEAQIIKVYVWIAVYKIMA